MSCSRCGGITYNDGLCDDCRDYLEIQSLREKVKELEQQNEEMLDLIILHIKNDRLDLELHKNSFVALVEKIKGKSIDEILKNIRGWRKA